MEVYVVIGLYQGLVDRVGVYKEEDAARQATEEFKQDDLETSGPHKEEVS